MKIKNINAYGRKLGLKRPYSIAYKTVNDVKCLFLEVELENGIVGIGSANPSVQVVGEDVDMAIKRMENDSFDDLIGSDISNFDSIKKKVRDRLLKYPGSMAALDIAMYDAYTQFLNVPLSAFFGRAHKYLPTSITIGIKNVEETLIEAKEYAERGFRILKIKTGLNPGEDAERVIKVHEKYADLKIRVDANQGYNADDLSKFVELTRNTPLELIEQPFSVENFSNFMKHCPPDVSTLVIADESIKDPSDAINLANEVPNCSLFNIKLMKCGGLTAASTISDIAYYSGKKLMWGCNDESIISISAALNLALSYQHTQFIDLDGSLDIAEDVVVGGFELNNGLMYPVDRPGLGVSLVK